MPDMTVSELASRLNGMFEGDGECPITGIAGLRDARPGDLSFLSNPKYAGLVAETQASAVLVPKDWDRAARTNLIRVENPDSAFAQAVAWFARVFPRPAPGIHPTAVVAPDVVLGKDVHLGPHVVVERGAVIGARTVISAGGVIGDGVRIGEDAMLYPLVSVREGCRIGNRVILHNGVVVGSDGFGYTADAQGVRTKIPQVGVVWIEDDVEIGANSTIDRARFGKTIIGRGTKIDNLVQIAHNVVIGEHAVIVAQAGIAGSTSIGARCMLAGQVGIAGHLQIGEGAVIMAQSGVSNHVPAGAYVFGSPAWPAEETARVLAVMHRLPELKKRLLEMEKRLAQVEARKNPPA